jgi:hypothetical protein
MTYSSETKVTKPRTRERTHLLSWVHSRIHMNLKTTQAVAARLCDHTWSVAELREKLAS